jgi:hypothetical protein
MAGQEGFNYEKKINKLLQESGLQNKSFQPAGPDSNAPDAMLSLDGKYYKVEVKLDLKVDFGQGSLDFDVKRKKWILGGAKTASAEQMRDFLESIGVPKIVEKEWGNDPPRKFTVPLNKFKKEDVEYDYRNFKDRYVDVPADSVANYYASKNTYYIQIGDGYGLFYMGKNPAKLDIPEFEPKLRLRIRLKRGGSTPIYNYRFTTALQAISLNKSNMSLEDKDELLALKARSKK